MTHLIHFFSENSVLAIFLVIALGYPLGRLKVGPLSLGVAGVLFAGLAAGAILPGIKPPEAMHILGLSLFVYAIGLSSGPSFIETIKHDGIKSNVIAIAALFLSTMIAVVSTLWIGGAKAAGLFAGALTNTPALAGIAESLRQSGNDSGAASAVMAYSVAYPFAIAFGTAIFSLASGKFSSFFGSEPEKEELKHTTVKVLDGKGAGCRIGDLIADGKWHAAFGRMTRDGVDKVLFPDEILMTGDLLTFVAPLHEIRYVCDVIGENVEDEHSRRDGSVDIRRIFLSNKKLAGLTVKELNLDDLYGAKITRIRRGDTDVVPPPEYRIEIGDRLRVVAPADKMSDITHYLGDSYQAVGELEMLSFALGHAVGLLVGAVAIPVGGATLKLGFAGGPLCVGLLLGSLRRTGPLIWQVPHAANMAVRQLGLSIFLAGIGLRAGGSLGNLNISDVWGLAIISVLITVVGILFTLAISAYWLKLSPARSCGVAAAVMTQPALLAWGQERFGCGAVDEGYATAYPLSMIAKVLMAQMILVMAFK